MECDPVAEHLCSLSQTMDVLGEKWIFFVVREAMAGTVKFSEFKGNLGMASDVLTDRLNALVHYGVMEKRSYQEPGQRARDGYFLTESGRQLNVVIAALQQWGEQYGTNPVDYISYRTANDDAVQIRFVDREGTVLDNDAVVAQRR